MQIGASTDLPFLRRSPSPSMGHRDRLAPWYGVGSPMSRLSPLGVADFQRVSAHKYLNIHIISISPGGPHCHLAPMLPQRPFRGSQVGNSSPFGALKAPLSPSCSSELALNGVKGWVPTAPASRSLTTGSTRTSGKSAESVITHSGCLGGRLDSLFRGGLFFRM